LFSSRYTIILTESYSGFRNTHRRWNAGQPMWSGPIGEETPSFMLELALSRSTARQKACESYNIAPHTVWVIFQNPVHYCRAYPSGYFIKWCLV